MTLDQIRDIEYSENELSQAAVELKDITSQYLHDFFKGRANSPTNTALHGVELQVSARQSSLDNVWAEVYGTVAFIEPPAGQTKASAETVHETLKQWVAQAFDLSNLAIYKQRLQAPSTQSDILIGVTTLSIDASIDASVNAPNQPWEPIPNPNQQNEEGAWSTAEFIMLGILLLFLCTAAFAIFVYYKVSSQNNKPPLYVDTSTMDGTFPRSPSAGIPHVSLQSSSHLPTNGSGGDPQIIPVGQQQGGRLYVKSTNPFEYLYGASFLHNERKSRGTVPQSPSNHIRPMLNNSEDELVQESPNHSAHGGISSWFQNTAASINSFLNKSEHSIQNQDHPFVYRDFPRHDGTPCLIYSHKEGDTPTSSAPISPASPPSVETISSPDKQSQFADDGSPTTAKKNHAALNKSNHSVDDFVQKLENLMRMKRRQFQQRQEMFLEKERRKAERRSRRNPAPSLEAQTGNVLTWWSECV